MVWHGTVWGHRVPAVTGSRLEADPGLDGDHRPGAPLPWSNACRCSKGTALLCRAGVGKAGPSSPKAPSPSCPQPGPCPWDEAVFPVSATWLEPLRGDGVRGCSEHPSPGPHCHAREPLTARVCIQGPCPAAGRGLAQTPWEQPPHVDAHGLVFMAVDSPSIPQRIPLRLGTNAPFPALCCPRWVNTVPMELWGL